MIILIEGIDRVGKTTLANKLSQSIGYPILKLNRTILGNKTKIDNEIETYGEILGEIKVMNFLKPNLIIDRFHWTEAVYSYVNRKSSFSLCMCDSIEAEMAKGDFFIVYVRPTNIEWSSNQHGAKLVEHNAIFDKLFLESKIRKIECCFDTIDEAIKLIKEAIRNESRL